MQLWLLLMLLLYLQLLQLLVLLQMRCWLTICVLARRSLDASRCLALPIALAVVTLCDTHLHIYWYSWVRYGLETLATADEQARYTYIFLLRRPNGIRVRVSELLRLTNRAALPNC